MRCTVGTGTSMRGDSCDASCLARNGVLLTGLRWANFNRSTTIISDFPLMSTLKVLGPLSMTLKGPSYGHWRWVQWAFRFEAGDGRWVRLHIRVCPLAACHVCKVNSFVKGIYGHPGKCVCYVVLLALNVPYVCGEFGDISQMMLLSI